MSTSNAAVLAASNSRNEVTMPKAESITRAPESEFSDILIKRDGEADLMLEKGRLLLTVETKPAGLIANAMTQRWKIYRLYGGKPPLIKDRFGKTPPFRTLVVAEEGHSNREGETTRYSARVCGGAVEVWEAMGKLDELKSELAALNLPVVERV